MDIIALLPILFVAIISVATDDPVNNVFIGIKFISFKNFESTIATGQCCDKMDMTAGSCEPHRCDTMFVPCVRHISSSVCDVVDEWETIKPPIYNNDSFNFPQLTGILMRDIPYVNETINVTITAVEIPDLGETGENNDIAEFTFEIDWLDPFMHSPPIFKEMSLTSTRATLVVSVFSQCNSNYYQNDCSVWCKPKPDAYTCLKDGSIKCLPGWDDPELCGITTTSTTTESTTRSTTAATTTTTTTITTTLATSPTTTPQVFLESGSSTQNYSATPPGDSFNAYNVPLEIVAVVLAVLVIIVGCAVCMVRRKKIILEINRTKPAE